MVLTLMVICRKAFGLEHIITLRHFDYMAKIMLVTGHDGRLRLRHGVLHRLVQRQPLRALHVHEPRARTVRLGLLDHDHLQRDQPAVFWFKKARTSIPILFVALDRRQHRHVVRALRDHRDVAAPRLPARRPGATSVPRSGTCRACSGASGSSSRCSACSCASCRWWRPPRSRPSCRRPIRTGQPGPEREIKDHAAPRPPAVAAARSRGSLADAAPRPAAPEGAVLRNPRRIRDAGGPLSRVRAGA